MRIHSYSKEDFGYLVSFREGHFGLYEEGAEPFCAIGADSEALAPYKLKRLTIKEDFHTRSPLVVWLEVTRGCNLRCRHCFVAAAGPQPDELSTDQILSLLDELKAQNVFCLVFTGGEPLLHPDFLHILDYAHRLGFVISVITNGLLLKETLLSRLPKENVRITISLDNLHFGETEGLDGNRQFSFLQTRLLLLKQHGVACHVSATMTRHNLSLLKTIFSWLVEQGIGFRTIPFTPIGRGALYPELQLRTTEVKQAAELWAVELANEKALQGTQGLTFSQCFDYALTLVYMCRGCKGGRFIAYICANGDVYPCTTCAGAGAYQAGNIKDSSFRDVWEASFKAFRQLSRWDNFAGCGKCRFSASEYFCTNRCPPLASLYRGSPCACGATAYDRSSLAYRTKLLHSIEEAESGNVVEGNRSSQ